MATPSNAIGLRRHDLDNLRSFLTGLVITHHTTGAYGGPLEPAFQSSLMTQTFSPAKIPLVCLNSYSQAFFMGSFFWISGRNSAQGLDRVDADPNQSRWDFVRSKAMRLGIPAVFYTLVLHPLSYVLVLKQWDLDSIGSYLHSYYSELRGIQGPVWYTANLLIFDCVAALLRPVASRKTQVSESSKENKGKQVDIDTPSSPPKWYQLANRYGWIAAAAASAVLRIWYPISYSIKSTGMKPGHAAQYIYAYIMGMASLHLQDTFSGPQFLSGISSTKMRLIVASTLSVLTIPVMWLPRMLSPVTKNAPVNLREAFGGLNPTSMVHSFWTEWSFALVTPAMMAYFQEHHSQPAQSSVYQPRYSYGAFLLHMVVSTVVEVGAEVVLQPVKDSLIGSEAWHAVAPTLMTVCISPLNAFASFAATKVLLNVVPFLKSFV